MHRMRDFTVELLHGLAFDVDIEFELVNVHAEKLRKTIEMDDKFTSSVRQHLHEVLCKEHLPGDKDGVPSGNGPCHRCIGTADKTLQLIDSAKVAKMGDFATLNLCTVKQLHQQTSNDRTGSADHDNYLYSCCCQKQTGFKQESQALHAEVLIGYLTNISQEGDKAGQMYLKDHSGAVLCQMLNYDMMWLRQLLVVFCWNYIAGSDKVCNLIEVCHHCQPLLVPLSDDVANITRWPACISQTEFQDDGMHVGDLELILKERSQEGAIKDSTTQVTVRGTVTTKSPLYRIRSTPFFFFELAADTSISKVSVLAKGIDTAYLFHFLQIGCNYTITRLLPTTINKGTKTPYPVLLCTTRTHIQKTDVSGLNSTPTISGMIVTCINKEVGIYELEKDVRLYLCYMYDGSKQHQHLRVGSKIAVYNAHDYRLGKPSKRCIICCMRSTIEITEHSPNIPSRMKTPDRSDKGLLYLILKLNPNPQRLHWLCDVWPRLQHKLGHGIISKKLDQSALWTLMTSSCAGSMPWIAPRKRNVYEEFLNHTGTSCAATKDNTDDELFIQFPTLNELCTIIMSDNARYISDSNNWKCQIVASTQLLSTKVLVGCLETDSHTGQLVLVDKTGSIQCLVTKTKDIDITCVKWSDFYSDITRKDDTNVVWLQPSMLDQLVRIEKFFIVLEEFVHCDGIGDIGNHNEISKDGCTSKNQRITQDSKNDWKHLYLVFNVIDIVMVCPKNNLEASKPVKRSASSAGLKLLDNEAAVGKNSSSKKPQNAVFLVKNKSLPQRKMGVSDGYSFHVDVELFDGGSLGAGGASVQRKARSAALWFDKEAIKWFPVLFSGGWYELEMDSDCTQGDLWLPSSKPSKAYLQKVIQTAGCPQVLHVSPAARLKALQGNEIPAELLSECQQLHTNLQSDVKTITQLINTESGPFDNVVSFWGSIVSCQYAQAKSARPHQDQPDWQMKLVIKDPASSNRDMDSTVRVYMNVLPSTYPAGLIPGSIVTFRRCIKVKSSKGNIAYQVGPLTDIRVEFVPCDDSNRQDAMARDDPHSNHQYYLSELSTNQISLDPGTHFTLTCHVLMIHLLVLRWSCDRCGHQECICAGTSADDYKPGKITAQTKFSVDDGTGEAIVWCHDVESVPVLLGLPSTVWQQMKELLPSYGKVVYKYSKEEQAQWQDAPKLPQPNDDLESVLSMLCTHNTIQQPIRMKCRLLHSNQQSKGGSYGNTQTDAGPSKQTDCKKYIPWLHLKCTELASI